MRRTDVVRLTTLAYHFAVDTDRTPWTSSATGRATRTRSACQALEDFAKEYGYRLRSEDFVDQGYYNATSPRALRAAIWTGCASSTGLW